jgi:hypothetical protein
MKRGGFEYIVYVGGERPHYLDGKNNGKMNLRSTVMIHRNCGIMREQRKVPSEAEQ